MFFRSIATGTAGLLTPPSSTSTRWAIFPMVTLTMGASAVYARLLDARVPFALRSASSSTTSRAIVATEGMG